VGVETVVQPQQVSRQIAIVSTLPGQFAQYAPGLFSSVDGQQGTAEPVPPLFLARLFGGHGLDRLDDQWPALLPDGSPRFPGVAVRVHTTVVEAGEPDQR